MSCICLLAVVSFIHFSFTELFDLIYNEAKKEIVEIVVRSTYTLYTKVH